MESLSQVPEDRAVGPLFDVEHVSRTFLVGRREVHALRNVSISIRPAEMVLIEGKSGSGKTTLLNLLGGLDTPSFGTITHRGKDIGTLSGRELTAWRRRYVGFIFQAFALLPGLSAFENVEVAGRIRGLSPVEAAERASYYLALVGIAKRSKHRISELSGGEQQRVAVARGLIGGPQVVFADEPTGELDHAMSRRVLDLLRAQVDNGDLTVCLTSHDRAVRGYAHRVYTLEDGRVVRETAQ